MSGRKRLVDAVWRDGSISPPALKAKVSKIIHESQKTYSSVPAKVATVISWNVETLLPWLSSTPKISSFFKANKAETVQENPLSRLLEKHPNVGFICLQEIRPFSTDLELIKALRKLLPGFQVYYSLCTPASKHKPGARRFGTCIYVRDDLVESIIEAREVPWDHEGRCVIIEMKTWTLVSVYALNGSEYSYDGKITRNERKRQFNIMLMEEVQKLQARTKNIILVGDFNISLTKLDCHPRLRTEYPHNVARKAMIEEIMPGMGVVDYFRHTYGDSARAYSWFSKNVKQGKNNYSNCARVDYALVHQNMLGSVSDMKYCEEEDERQHSDHGPFVLTLNIPQLP